MSSDHESDYNNTIQVLEGDEQDDQLLLEDDNDELDDEEMKVDNSVFPEELHEIVSWLGSDFEKKAKRVLHEFRDVSGLGLKGRPSKAA